jgi:hypothetical protein
MNTGTKVVIGVGLLAGLILLVSKASAAASKTALSALSCTAGTLSPAFSPSTLNYVISAPGLRTCTFSYVCTVPASVLEVGIVNSSITSATDWIIGGSPATSSPITLVAGPNYCFVSVYQSASVITDYQIMITT